MAAAQTRSAPIGLSEPVPVPQLKQVPAPVIRAAPDLLQADTYITPSTEKTPILRTAAQLNSKPGDDEADFYIQTNLPGDQRLFNRYSEAAWREKVRLEAAHRGGQRVIFPEEPVVSRVPYRPRVFDKTGIMRTEPGYVCHGRVPFEQLNFDRYGWELGYLQPAVSLGIFYYDAFMLPYHTWTKPCDITDCSAGKCLPGDNVDLRFYPEKLSVSGLAGQALFLGTGYFIFP